MSSYDSQNSPYLHPSQYPPPHNQPFQPQPPYPTTPGSLPTSQPQPFYPPHQQQNYQSNQPFYSTSPTAHQSYFSTSVPTHPSHLSTMYEDTTTPSSPSHQNGRSTSFSQHQGPSAHRPSFPGYQSAPIAIGPNAQQSWQPYSGSFPPPPTSSAQNAYAARRHSSSSSSTASYSHPHSHHAHRHYSHGGHHHHHHHHDDSDDSEDEHAGRHDYIDPDTLRSYERRYAKDRLLEKRPTLGGSLMSVVGKVMGK